MCRFHFGGTYSLAKVLLKLMVLGNVLRLVTGAGRSAERCCEVAGLLDGK